MEKVVDMDGNILEVGNIVNNELDFQEYEVVELMDDNNIKLKHIIFNKESIINADMCFILTDSNGNRYDRDNYIESMKFNSNCSKCNNA